MPSVLCDSMNREPSVISPMFATIFFKVSGIGGREWPPLLPSGYAIASDLTYHKYVLMAEYNRYVRVYITRCHLRHMYVSSVHFDT